MAPRSVAPSTKFGAIPLDPSFYILHRHKEVCSRFMRGLLHGYSRFVTRFMRSLCEVCYTVYARFVTRLFEVCHKVYTRFVTRFVDGIFLLCAHGL